MDPNANLLEQLQIAKEIQQIRDRCDADGTYSDSQKEQLVIRAERLAELVEALDGWLSKGGFLPERWRAQ